MGKIKALLKKYTGHEHVELTSRGNTAIFAALYCARKLNLDKKTVMIPDQGGWLTYKKYAKMLELIPSEFRTDEALINAKLLKSFIASDVNCVLYENPGGYFVQQPMKEIYSLGCTIIADVSGCIGTDICNGEHADIMLGSFGKWKPVEAGYGGFISFKNKETYELSKEIFNTTDFDVSKADLVYEKLKNAKQRYDKLWNECDKIKTDLEDYEISHKNSKGLVVIVKYYDEKTKQDIVNYCKKHKYEYTQCPRYIRIMKDAISIEVKRL